MKHVLFSLAIAFSVQTAVHSKTFYISTKGNNSNSGLTTGSSWRNLSYAASLKSPVRPGDTVYIKAGNYSGEKVIFERGGYKGSIIVFAGYQALPGDTPEMNYRFGDAANSSLMPLFDGGDRANNIGLDLQSKGYISLKNIQIINYAYALNAADASNITIDNIFTMSTGDKNSSYSGRGIQFGSYGSFTADNNIIRNCIVVNSCAEGLSVTGNGNLIENSRVYCGENSNVNASMDYYLVVTGDNNTIENCYTERVGNLSHFGHGIGVKYDSKGNTFNNCKSVNMSESFYVRHRGAKYNTFNNCKSLYGRGVCVRDGASFNTFSGCISDSTNAGAWFEDTSEDGGAQYAGRHNVFKNCIFTNTVYGLQFDAYDQVSAVDSNSFINCVFHNVDYLVYTGKDNFQNTMVNCIISNVKKLKAGPFALNFNYNFSDFYNNGFAKPAGNGNVSINPQFVDPAGSDFHLLPTSPCIDAGVVQALVAEDLEGNSREEDKGYDMGVYEFKDMVTGIGGPAVKTDNAVFPNPSNGKISVTAKSMLSVEVINSGGQVVQVFGNINKDSVGLDLSALPKGVYLIKAKTASRNIIQKVFFE